MSVYKINRPIIISVCVCTLTFKLSVFHAPFWFPGIAASLGHSHVLFGPPPPTSMDATLQSLWCEFSLPTTLAALGPCWRLRTSWNLDLLSAVGEHSGLPESSHAWTCTFTVLSTTLGRWLSTRSYCHQNFQMEASPVFPLLLVPWLRGKSIVLLLPWEVGARTLCHFGI